MCKAPCPFTKSCKKKYGSKSCNNEQKLTSEECKNGYNSTTKGVLEKKAEEERMKIHKKKLAKKEAKQDIIVT